MDGRGSTEGTQRRTKVRTKPGPPTKRRRPGADRLSALSDELLLRILSFLGIREAVSTSCLSRRWRDLYHHLPSLDFSSEVWDNESSWFIDRVLLLHAAPRIEVFRLSMRVEVGDSSAFRQIDSRLLFAVRRGARVLDLDIDVVPDSYGAFAVRHGVPPLFHCRTLVTSNPTIPQHPLGDTFVFPQIDSRLLFALRRGVRVLDLHIDVIPDSYEEGYGVPPWVFHCRTLEDLSVKKGYLRLPTHFRLVSLKKMRLSLIEFEDNQLESLLRGCPLLQSLELVHCNSYDYERVLVIDTREGRNLEELIIVDGIDENCRGYHASKMQIDAPSVKYLRFRSTVLRGEFEVRDLSSLVVASFRLDFDGSGIMGEDKVDAFVTGLLLRIPRVQVLKLCRWSLEALSKRELRGNLVSALSNVTRLELTIGLEEPQLQAILSALHACSNLRALVLSIPRHMKTLDSSASDETEIPQSLALDSDIVMQDLKRIVIQGLTSYYNQNPAGKGGGVEEDFVAKKKGNCIVFIGFLLRVSPVLEELIVKPSKRMNKMTRKWELLSNLYSDLLALPRASSCAKVIIDGK